MVAPFVENSTTFTYNASSAESHATSTLWYETIIVVNNTNQPFFVATDGGTATSGGAHEGVVGVGLTAVFGNEQQLPQPNETYAGAWNAGTFKFYDGQMDTGGVAAPSNPMIASSARNQSQAVNWSSQVQGMIDANGTPTYCSIIPLAATSASNANLITVIFQ